MKNKTLRLVLVLLALATVLCFASCSKSYDSVGNSSAELAPETPEIGITMTN